MQESDPWDNSLISPSRIHPLPLPSLHGNSVFIKREDEVGYALSGGKLRKFASLIPFLKREGFQQVIVIGGSHSNQVLAAVQLLRQAGLGFQLFLKEGHHEGPGNGFLIEMLVPRSEWTVIGSKAWPDVEALAHDFAASQTEKTFVLPEGAWCPEALGGSLSLGKEILEQGEFDHVLLEAGTGLSAIGLLISLAMSPQPPAVHVLLMAMEAEEFGQRLATAMEWTRQHYPQWVPDDLPAYKTYRPENAKAFGSVNTTIIKSILESARKYGILTDPIYSGKLFLEAERILASEPIEGNILLIHSGGQSSLPGFFEKFKPFL